MDIRLNTLLGEILCSGPGAVFVDDEHGYRIAIVPVRELSTRELEDACRIYAALGRGLLVVA